MGIFFGAGPTFFSFGSGAGIIHGWEREVSALKKDFEAKGNRKEIRFRCQSTLLQEQNGFKRNSFLSFHGSTTLPTFEFPPHFDLPHSAHIRKKLQVD